MQNTRKITVELSDSFTADHSDLSRDLFTFRSMVESYQDHAYFDHVEDHRAILRIFHYLLAIDNSLKGGQSC